MIVGSLFTGIGGFDLGLERAGHRVTWQCEADEWRRGVLAHHFDAPCSTDVREWPSAGPVPMVDLLCGGFPCQDLSVAGRRAGLAGERSGLFYEFARVADVVLPAGGWLLVENVPGLLSSQRGRDFAIILATLADLGFHDLAWRVLDSRHFGVAQRRRRVYILARRARGSRACQVLLEPESRSGDPTQGGEAGQGVATTSALGTTRGGGHGLNAEKAAGGQLVTAPALVKRYGKGTDSDATDCLIADTVRSHPRPGSNSNGQIVAFHQTQDPISEVDCSPALGRTSISMGIAENQRGELLETDYAHQLTSGGGKPGQGYGAARTPEGVRRLTPTECERLQGFPDGWTAHGPDSRRYAALGDAVTVNVAEWIGRRLMEAA